jgi:hypothetical protein
MTRGVVIFAHDSGRVKYTEFASWSAKRINRYLDLPVTIVTDSEDLDRSVFDQVIQKNPRANGSRDPGDGQLVDWLNLDRFCAWDLSPYDETLLLDADYLVSSAQLSCLFGCDQDILSMRWAYDITNRKTYEDMNFFGRHHQPSAWATVIYFKKTQTAKLVFDMMQMIQENWHHYRDLYGVSERRYRNDYSLAIASNNVMGHTGDWPCIPWSMANIESDCVIKQVDHDEFHISYRDSKTKERYISVRSQDLHVMNKTNLGDLVGTGS